MDPIACFACGRTFTLMFRYQRAYRDGRPAYYCSQHCREPGLAGAPAQCHTCARRFTPTLVVRISQQQGARLYFCTATCRAAHEKPVTQGPPPPAPSVRALAVLNQKGGTAKTTTSVSLAAGLAALGMPPTPTAPEITFVRSSGCAGCRRGRRHHCGRLNAAGGRPAGLATSLMAASCR